MALDRHIWHSCISFCTKLRLYISCILPIFLYGVETWAVTAMSAKTFDALDQWCLRHIRNIHWSGQSASPTTRSDQEPNNEQPTVWRSPLQTPSLLWSYLQSWPQSGSLSSTVRQCYWSAQALEERPGRPRQTWLQTIKNDLRPLNLGLATAQRLAQNRTAWQTLTEMATSLTSSGRWWTNQLIKWTLRINKYSCKLSVKF